MSEVLIHSQVVVMRDPVDLVPWPENIKSHTVDSVAEVAGMIQTFGFTRPILVDEDDWILAGHKARQASLGLSMKQVPTVVVAGLSDSQKRALRIADNKSSENSVWDMANLKAELQSIMDTDPVDLGLTGFDFEEINDILNGSLDDITDDGEDDDIPKISFLTVGSHKVELTAEEKDALVARMSTWSKKKQSYAGLASFMVAAWDHAMNTGVQA